MYYLGHKSKGVFIGWAFGVGIPIWSSEIPILREKSKSSFMDKIMSMPVPCGKTPAWFATKETGWMSGHLFERYPDDVFLFESPDDLAELPKSISLGTLETTMVKQMEAGEG